MKRLLCLFGFLLSTVQANPLWNTTANGAAAKFAIQAGGTAITSNDTIITAYNSADCTGGSLGNATAGGLGYTFNPSTNVQANSASIYTIITNASITASGVHSITVAPRKLDTSDVFTTTPCFPVTCSGADCTYTGAAVAVSLNN